DFSLAALLWIAAGLLLAILCVRGAGKHRKKEQEDNYGAEGMSLGMCCKPEKSPAGIGAE
ncbi:MAG: hypothetical protein SO031_02650, partial [Candidatus Ventricola sp.]|nr:hypothetical protein [Candidatus Ventricola sp.]